MDRPFGVEQLETVRGAGYRLCEEPRALAASDEDQVPVPG
jgi:hypothetical protein